MVPDVHVRPDPAGGWRVELNADTLPRLLIDKRYHGLVQAGARSETEKTFVAECAAQASWLVKSLDQRAKTILKVGSEIVRQQDAFLAFGVEFLRPLNLKTVADAIGMHESTVSRVTSNKYVSTPRGVFELKFFFTAAIQSSDGGATHSAEAVRHRIKAMIDGEGRDGDDEADGGHRDAAAAAARHHRTFLQGVPVNRFAKSWASAAVPATCSGEPTCQASRAPAACSKSPSMPMTPRFSSFFE